MNLSDPGRGSGRGALLR